MSDFENDVLKRLKTIEDKLRKLVPDEVETDLTHPIVPAPHVAIADDEKGDWIQAGPWDITRGRGEE